MYEIGSVVILKRIIFKTCKENDQIISKYRLDHAHGRPAVVIAEDEESTYFLHVVSNNFENIYSNQYYLGSKSDNTIGGFICLDSIQKRNLSYREEIMKLDNLQLKELLIEFCNYQENIRMDEEYSNIKQIVYGKITELEQNAKGKRKQKKNGFV